MTKPRITYDVQPQRRSPAGWIACEPHAADRFAVLRIQHFNARGHRTISTKVVSSWGRKIEAEAAADTLRTLAAKGRRGLRPKPGDRWPAAESRKVIATGLGDDYHSTPTHTRFTKE